MNRFNRRECLSLIGISLTALIVATPTWAKPKMTRTRANKADNSTTSVRAVQEYLRASATKNWARAYQFFSPVTQRIISWEFFQEVKDFPNDPTADGMTPKLTAVSAMFIDAPRFMGYRYSVVGPVTGTPDVVLVDAQPISNAPSSILHLKIVTIDDPKVGPRLDFLASLQRSDPKGYPLMKQWAEAKTQASIQREQQLKNLESAP